MAVPDVKLSAVQMSIHREMDRRSRDKIAITNPMDIDFRFMWDSRWYKLPHHQEKVMERYLVERATEDMAALILGQLQLEKGQALLADRKARGLNDYLNKYDENKDVWDNVQRTDDEQRRAVIKTFGLRLVEEYGVEEAPQEVQMMKSISQRPAALQIMDEMTQSFKPQEEAVEETTEPSRPVVRRGRPPKIEEVTNEG